MTATVFYDLETTGLSVDEDRVVQLAACAWHDGAERSFASLVNPRGPLRPQASRVNGFTAADLAAAPDFKAAWGGFVAFVRSLGEPSAVKLIGHNSRAFDDRLLAAELQRHGLGMDAAAASVFRGDTMLAARKLLRCPFVSAPAGLARSASSAKLVTLYEARFKTPLANAHDALADCRAVRLLVEDWKELRERLEFEPWSTATASLRGLRERKGAATASKTPPAATLVFLPKPPPPRSQQPQKEPRTPSCRRCSGCGRVVSVFFAHDAERCRSGGNRR